MMSALLKAWTGVDKPVIGMLHLLPLPGSPRFGGSLSAVTERVLHDADALVAGGVHGLIIENFGDTPFYPQRVPPEVVAHMTSLAIEVRERCDVPLGINVLRNDGCSALAIAHAVGAELVRVNVLCGARVTDQGLTEGIAHELLRERVALGAERVKILADINVKHSAPLGPPRSIADEVADTIERGGADVIVVSGSATGQATSVEEVRQAKAAAGDTPVFVGSGVTADTIGDYLRHADGFIIGTALKHDGVVTNPVDAGRVREMMQRLS
jgi:membrane complex biogenesis BtpA family protein